MTRPDRFNARQVIQTPLGPREVYRLDALKDVGDITALPYSVKVLLEACLRQADGQVITQDDIEALARYSTQDIGQTETPFKPGRVVLQDFTGVPAVVDLAAMRDAMRRMGGDPSKVNPLVPCDLVIDHSVQVDAFASNTALTINSQKEFERNHERYGFLKWGQQAFNNFRVVPPATGIVHQVNLEYLAKVVWDDGQTLYPDSLVGTDSHTTMINGLGVVGWGVGGIEAEAVMLGQPIYMLIPQVVGMKFTGSLPGGCTATDLVLTVTQLLRSHGVVGKFVEFFGPGLDQMPLATRATIANMAPEYGATVGFFPIDQQTLNYLTLSGRDDKLVQTVQLYATAQGLWRNDDQDKRYETVVHMNLADVEPSLAGPKRPQDRIALGNMKTQWRQILTKGYDKPVPVQVEEYGAQPIATGADPITPPAAVLDPDTDGVEVNYDNHSFTLKHGAVAIAAITSCTNTSNPYVMIGAGLLARKAVEKGLTRKPWVKSSLAPGSKVVTDYLEKAGLMADLQALGYHLVGYGCTTCIGNSGPLPDPISNAINEHDLVVCSVLSGNRNFEGRISPDVKANFLASPPLVVAYAIAGTVDIDLATEPLGVDRDGRPVYLKDIWPSQGDIQDTVAQCVTRQQFIDEYAQVFDGSRDWQSIPAPAGSLYQWQGDSTYVQEPPFFVNLSPDPSPIEPIHHARCLVKLGDSVTTDHISPAGAITSDSPAGKYLTEQGVPVSMFNSYGSRRGNDRVMTRGTFANIRIRNQLAPDTEGGWTLDFTDQQAKSIYDAAMNYQHHAIPLVVLAGTDYGMGSSRDWAAKGTYLLGIKAVIAQSFERIHRSNLVGMGVLPLCYHDGDSADSLGLTGQEKFDIHITDDLQPRQLVEVAATAADGSITRFTTTCRIDTPVEVDYYRHGGILHNVLRNMAK